MRHLLFLVAFVHVALACSSDAESAELPDSIANSILQSHHIASAKIVEREYRQESSRNSHQSAVEAGGWLLSADEASIEIATDSCGVRESTFEVDLHYKVISFEQQWKISFTPCDRATKDSYVLVPKNVAQRHLKDVIRIIRLAIPVFGGDSSLLRYRSPDLRELLKQVNSKHMFVEEVSATKIVIKFYFENPLDDMLGVRILFSKRIVREVFVFRAPGLDPA